MKWRVECHRQTPTQLGSGHLAATECPIVDHLNFIGDYYLSERLYRDWITVVLFPINGSNCHAPCATGSFPTFRTTRRLRSDHPTVTSDHPADRCHPAADDALDERHHRCTFHFILSHAYSLRPLS